MLREKFRQYPLSALLLLIAVSIAGLLFSRVILQIIPLFSHSTSVSSSLLVWGIGALAIAYGFRSTIWGIGAILLIGLGYWGDWNNIYLNAESHSIALQMPIVAAILFLPLAYWCRSGVLFGLSAIAVCSALISSLAEIVTKGSVLPPLVLGLPAALLWSYDDAIWTLGRQEKQFQPIARRLAVLYLSGLFFCQSFQWTWANHAWYSILSGWRSLPSVVFLAAITIGQWLYLFISMRKCNWQTIMIASMIALYGIVQVWHLRVQPIPIFAAIVFNLMLVVLSITTIRSSLRAGERSTFWCGVTFLILQISSRALEYDLPVKPLIFGLCGMGAIVSGLWFERYCLLSKSPILGDLGGKQPLKPKQKIFI
ncbi:hypothetical protein H6F51_20025 [Cyanobacteria bacterium FACHB-DQ100]|uniref:hypothetical protein n=1 Tax=Leptolyngbya sp. DQ-M1 TaxID=2933920 RepID=UPI0019C5E891|nr:hypothetical protein [Cyanobacteria bacterium FACHB-DQ100]